MPNHIHILIEFFDINIINAVVGAHDRVPDNGKNIVPDNGKNNIQDNKENNVCDSKSNHSIYNDQNNNRIPDTHEGG